MKRMCIIILLVLVRPVQAQKSDTLRLTLDQAVSVARKNSPDVLVARNTFHSSYWQYCYFRANYLPSLTFTSSPNFQHNIDPIILPDGTTKFVDRNQILADASLNISQVVPWTGGTVSIGSTLQRLDQLGKDRSTSYSTNPIVVRYQQDIFGINNYKWDKKIEPLAFEEAKRSYVEKMELVSLNTIYCFFNLAMAQANLKIATLNHASADTLYTFARGRYDIGTINESEMLQLEVNLLSEESSKLEYLTQVDNCMEELRIYLGITEDIIIEAVIDDQTPLSYIDPLKAVELGLQNSPDILNMERQLLSSRRSIAHAKSLSGIKASIFAELGLSQAKDNFRGAYKDVRNQQVVSLGITLPILDWGKSKGNIQVAKSNAAVVETTVEQNRINFEFNISKIVKQFNLQQDMVNVAARKDVTASRRNDVTMRLYMLGRSSILDLNSAIKEKDTAKRDYVSVLREYWRLYYTLRSITLYDFIMNKPLTEDFEALIK